MSSIIFLVVRRMRAPLLALIAAYAIAVLGLALIPGANGDGAPVAMSIFDAFYFVSFMATTIGFGEIPAAFTGAQRLWVTFSIYMTVIVWIYSIGTLLALLQDRAFQQAITELRFTRMVRFIREPFYLVCGYGETGSALIKALTQRDCRAVTIDLDPQRIDLLALQNLRQFVPGYCGDAALPDNLKRAGIEHPFCAGVIALTDVNEVNLKVAITAKLLNRKIKVICRADSHSVEANMASFGTDHIIDPFDTFAEHFAMLLRTPHVVFLQQWLTGKQHDNSSSQVTPPLEGLWVLCGFGRFGRTLYERLQQLGMRCVVVESYPREDAPPPDGFVFGHGTEAHTLRAADIENAVGLIAGTDDDANNLSIIMTAREINPRLYVIARQNLKDNECIMGAVRADLVMHASEIIASQIRVLLALPLWAEFLKIAQRRGDNWAGELIRNIAGNLAEYRPHTWEVRIDERQSPALAEALRAGADVQLRDLLRDPRERDSNLGVLALLHVPVGRGGQPLPAENTRLAYGDALLLCGTRNSQSRMDWTLQNERALEYVLTGTTQQSLAWKLILRIARKSGAGAAQ